MYSYGPPHMAEQKQDDQHEHTFSNYVRIRDVVQKTCLRRWTIGKSGEKGSGISVLPAHDDDDDDDDDIYKTHFCQTEEHIRRKFSMPQPHFRIQCSLLVLYLHLCHTQLISLNTYTILLILFICIWIRIWIYEYVYEDRSNSSEPHRDFRFVVHLSPLNGHHLHDNSDWNLY